PDGPKGLEKGELRLDADDVRRNRVDDPPEEAGAALGGRIAVDLDVADELDREEIGARVEPDEELRALALDRLGQPVGEQGRRNDGLGAHGRRLPAKAARSRAASRLDERQTDQRVLRR